MTHFFRVYKDLEDKQTAVNEIAGRERAICVVREAIAYYKENFT